MARAVRESDLTRMLPKSMRQSVLSAWKFSQTHLRQIKRRTGEDYAEHGLELAKALMELSPDATLVRVALLHDILIHPDGENLLASSPLTRDERELVHTMHTMRRLHIDASTEDLTHTVEAITSDVRLLPLRMAHRLNDVRHFYRFEKKIKLNMAKETLHMYSAIAGRMGLQSWRREMEDTCFAIVQPKVAEDLRRSFEAMYALDMACLHHTKVYLQKKLSDAGINAEIDFRLKGQYSSYCKMVAKNRTFEQLSDRLALRILVPKVTSCYEALGVVHQAMHPIPGKLKDYIGAPKQNGYRSIHTVVYPLPGITEQPMEIQIRTADMHQECEYGVASHHGYKDLHYSFSMPAARVDLLRNLEMLKVEAGTPEQFESALRSYFHGNHIVIFDAGNNLYHVKKPATALDFACFVHGKRSSKVKSIRINGREKPLHTELRDGDTVEVHFARTVTFQSHWMHACKQKTSKALLKSYRATLA